MTQKNPSTSPRAPLTTEELECLKANDLGRIKLTDEEKARLRDINKARQQERSERAKRLRIEEEPILAELRAVGWKIESVWDLVNTPMRYTEAIPILLRHLSLPYSDRIREGIARSLAVSEPEVYKAWSTLVEEYRKAPTGWGFIALGDAKEYRLGAKDALACALSVAVTDETLPELIALAKDHTQGESRVLLLPALKKRKNKSSVVAQTIDELIGDPELKKEIASW